MSAPYFNRRRITIDHTKCGTVDTDLFPMLFTGTYAYLADVANGGKLRTGYAFDFDFFADKQLTVRCPYEVVYYDNTTGQIVAWVQAPRLSATVDTQLYLGYGATGITDSLYWRADIDRANCPFDTTYRGVWHLADGNAPGSDNLVATTISGTFGPTLAVIHGAPTVTTGPPGLTGIANMATSFSAAGYDALTAQTSGIDTLVVGNTTDVTVEAWAYTTNFQATAEILNVQGSSKGFNLLTRNYAPGAVALFGNTEGADDPTIPAASISNSNWHRIIGMITGTTGVLYLDGSQVDTGATVATIGDLTAAVPATIGYGGIGSGWNGKLAEIRISNFARSASYVTADWNSQNSPSTFYTVGAEENIRDDLSRIGVADAGWAANS